MTVATNRFSDRVDNYVKYRPHYPAEVIDFLKARNIISESSVIADIGSGTGISADLFLKNNYKVIGVEPNEPMRLAAETILKNYSNKGFFASVDGKAEATTLENNSVDVILCAQAFHWFNNDSFKEECKRILKPNGFVVLMWNDRRTNSTDFLKVYEDFLQMFGTDYKEINHKNTQEKLQFDNFFGTGNYKEKSFYNYQDVDFEGLKGRVLSSSYMPNEGHADFDHMIYCLRKIFNRYQVNNLVRLDYDTKIYFGQL